MKKVIPVIVVLVLFLMLTSCKGQDAVPENTPENTQTAQQNIEPSAVATMTPYTYVDTAEVYADPDAYKEKLFESLFMVKSGKQEYEGGKTIYYAAGYSKDETVNTGTIFEFGGREVPELVEGEIVYVRGTIEGKGFISDGKGNSVDMLWLDVTEIEYDASKANITSPGKGYSFEDGEYAAKNDTLSIEIMSLDFSQDGFVLNTKTVDSSVKKMETYYFDIIIHQDGYFDFYSGCNFWIQPNGMTSFDSIPFRVMDSTKDMTIMFVPFTKDNTLIYAPLTVEIDLSNKKAD